ncbi:hypothetical protein TWF481_000615 [Arthrobotrys musiformis]|uniref:Uncharacterized protein n=1 Tax=Arthrobotrys musiformis TaxID=47236 RepID=A0AAV9WN43_9PEZI
MFAKSISVLFALLALVSITSAIPFKLENKNALDLNKRATCNADNLLRYLRSLGAAGQSQCKSYLGVGSTTSSAAAGETKTVTVATESLTTTWTKSLISTKTVYSTITLAATTNTKSVTVTSTTTVTATQTIIQFKAAKAKVRKDKIEKRGSNIILNAYPSSRVSSACSCILTLTAKPADTPTATVSVTATSTVNVDTTVFIISTVTSTITQSAAAVETAVTDTVLKTETTKVYTRVWIA